MKKTAVALSSALLLGGLAACNNGEDQAFNGRYDYNAREIGYYSEHKRNGDTADNDGPLTEMMDRNYINEVGDTDNNGYPQNMADNDRDGIANESADRNGLNDKKGGWSRSDFNYSGQVDDLGTRAKNSYYNEYDGKTAERISKRVSQIENIDDARTVVYNDSVLVAVDTDDSNNKDVKQKVKRLVRTMAKGKDVRVVTDEGTFTRVRNIDNDLRNGNSMKEIQNDIKDMFDGLDNNE